MSRNSTIGSPLQVSKRFFDKSCPTAEKPDPCLMSRVSLTLDFENGYYEEFLQDVIHRCPNLLPVGDFYPYVTDLVSLGREIPIDIGAGKTGYVDNLFVTNDAHLVLVETKLYRNPEATREVVAQTLQYGMAVTGQSLDEFEECLRRAENDDRLGKEETVFHRVTSMAVKNEAMTLAEDFEETFDSLRRDREILLLIVTDGMHSSAERLVGWINNEVGSAPYRFGLVELRIYDLPEIGRIIVPRTLSRITEASRHVVIVKTERPKEELVYTVSGAETDTPLKKSVSKSPSPITEEMLTARIRATVSPAIAEMVEELRSRLASISPRIRATATMIQYGVEAKGDFIPLVSFGNGGIWFQIPTKAIKALGDERFVSCKKKINSVAVFYRPEDVLDPSKGNALSPKYDILLGKTDSFLTAFAEIAEIVRNAVEEME